MRKVTFGGASSLDNFFARKDDAVDWLLWSVAVILTYQVKRETAGASLPS